MTDASDKPRKRGTRKLVLATSLGVALGVVGLAASAPERVLEAEYARQRWLAGAEVVRFDIAGHRWAALEAGEGSDRPLVVLVHGFTGSKENWLPLMREMSRKYRLLAPDLPGWGGSDRLADGNYGPAAQADRLADLLRSLPEKPALLVGHSMGGQIVGLVAARHPGLVDRISLMSSAGVRYQENAFANAVLAGENPFQVTNSSELKRYLGIVFEDPPFVPWPASEALVRRRRADAVFEQRVLDGIGRAPDAFALEDELANIRAATLLLWCRDDRVIDVSAADVFHRGLERSATVILAGCGHMPMMVQPRQVADAIGGFMGTAH